LAAYEDPLSADGIPITNGYGSTKDLNGNLWVLGAKISEHIALQCLERDVDEAFQGLDIPHWDKLSPYQQAALADLRFNTGFYYKDGKHDTLDLVLYRQAYERVGFTLQMYDDKDQLGVSRRRFAEWLMFSKSMNPREAYEMAWAMNSVDEIMKEV
jgi:GH24 family phage-related lysozyme (muramidase)